MKTLCQLCATLVAVALLCGCNNDSAQRKAYARAVQMEQHAGGHASHRVIDEYKKVIQMGPTSGWADKAQQRIDIILQNIDADLARLHQLRLEEERRDQEILLESLRHP